MQHFCSPVGQLNEVHGFLVLGAGVIPPELCKLTELKVLNLEYNDIVGV